MTRHAQRSLLAQPTLANWGKAAPAGIGVVEGYGVATGGTTLSNPPTGYTVLSFTSDSDLTVTTAGLFDVMLIGGGAGGGGFTDGYVNKGGGGAGGIARATIYLAATTHAVDIGAGGGITVNGLPTTLGSTTIASHVAPYGLGGGTANAEGASGGGGLNNSASGSAGITGMGSTGGGGNGSYGANTGAGGGGGSGGTPARAVGNTGGSGGPGTDISSFITSVVGAILRAGGGGGSGSTGGAGGSGGGGSGSNNVGGGSNGTANTGSGGGTYASGGSGIVYVRFKV